MAIKHIALGSISKIKSNALKDALGRLRAIGTTEVPWITSERDVDTGLPAQPIGLEQTLLGAYRRAHQPFSTDSVESAKGTLYIGIESGVILLPNAVALGERHPFAVDLAVVYLLPGDTKVPIIAISQGVMLRYGDTQNVLLKGGTQTIGQIMAKNIDELDPRDPHPTLCGRSRQELLAETLFTALLQTTIGANAPGRKS